MDALSDDDQRPCPAPAKPPPQPVPGKRCSYSKPPAELRGHLGRLCRTLCLCARQSRAGLEALFQLNVSLNKLAKQDKDCKALRKRPTNYDSQC